ncbi:MAG TPA: hypothetical protein VNO83_03870 [Pseudonocardia sp.]|nr:hypothetical protein [Pseudonocardia sp.]
MADRRPGLVPEQPSGDRSEQWPAAVRVGPVIDSDGDARPDSVLLDDGVDLVLCTDLDGDGLADRELRIGPDGAVREARYRFGSGSAEEPAAASLPGDSG